MRDEEAIKRTGYGISGDIGGINRQTYFTPDGRRVRAIPNLRDYQVKDKDGNVIETGRRDANYDRGWLPIMPTQLKPHCDGCDEWHDTQEEIDICIRDREEKVNKWEAWARKEKKEELKDQGKEMEELRMEVLELTGMVRELTQVMKKEVKADG